MAATSFTSHTTVVAAHQIVTDLTVCFFSPTDASSTCKLDPRIWYRYNTDLLLYTGQQSAWLFLKLANYQKLVAKDLVVTDIRVGEPSPNLDHSWESRPGGIWVRREEYSGNIDKAVTEVVVLFGVDAVDPRPQWILMISSLQLNAQPKVPVARLSVLRGRAKPDARAALRIREDGTFKIVQISDTHMVTGVGVCKDAIDAHGNHLPESEADPLTVNFIEKVLRDEEPGLVVFTGDQLHHDLPDSLTALLKVVAPIIKLSIPFAVVFGNHDSEGTHALSRE
jgi:hypothetical protein